MSQPRNKDSNAPSGGVRDTHEIVGARMRELRKAKGMTLQQLAGTTELSVGYLSQLEREQAVPSIRALNTISRSLGVNISWFFLDPERRADPEATIIVRAARRSALRFESGIRDELLCPSLGGNLEMLLCTFEPGASSGELYAHDGEEAGYVSEGQLELRIDDETYLLNAGDSFHFDCKRPHGYGNPSDQRTVVVWSVTPPHY
ncbi:transcriptional regulator, XRE family with cupin sensor [Paracoccus saliphilus]|uniref:Helix-turn-helix transcriptional regulator n=2 Tax=Paracoccus saliphilus TaxID=405559 RepID=A0AA45W7Y6_9RHOB|nr:helix-turn-helix transcriptional regulator [Paracoccus saliphilus]SIT12908.1 transcriptional regulator, XRE family with cupin sensor [Paracoccus saliphilus]